MMYILSKEELEEIKQRTDAGLTVKFHEEISEAQYFSFKKQIENYINGGKK